MTRSAVFSNSGSNTNGKPNELPPSLTPLKYLASRPAFFILRLCVAMGLTNTVYGMRPACPGFPCAFSSVQTPRALNPHDLRNAISDDTQPSTSPNLALSAAFWRSEPPAPGLNPAMVFARKRLPAGSTIHQRPLIFRTRKKPSGLPTFVPSQPPYSSKAGSGDGVKPGMRSTVYAL